MLAAMLFSKKRSVHDLIKSTRGDRYAIVKDLLDNTTDEKELKKLIEERSPAYVGTTPLMEAAILGDINLLNLLIQKGADVNAVSFHKTCLDFAIENEKWEVLNILLQRSTIKNLVLTEKIDKAKRAGYNALAEVLLEQNKVLQENFRLKNEGMKVVEEVVNIASNNLKCELSNLDSQVKDHTTSINTLDSQVKDHTTSINTLNGQVKDHNTKIAKIENLIELYQNDNKKEIIKIQDEIKAQQSRIVELEERTKDFPELLKLAEEYKEMQQRMDKFEINLKKQEKQLVEINFNQIKLDIEKNNRKIQEQENKINTIQTTNEGNVERLDEHEKELIKLKLEAAENQRILESLEEFLMSDKVKQALQEFIELQEQQARIYRLDEKPYQYGFYNHFVQQINAVYLASSVIQTDIVKCEQKGIVGKIGNAVKILSRYVPLVGIAVNIFGSLLVKLDSNMQHKMIKNFYDLAIGPVDIDNIAKKTALTLLPESSSLSLLDVSKLEEPDSFKDKLYNLLEYVIENVEAIIDLVEGDNAERKKFLLKEGQGILKYLATEAVRTLTSDNKESLKTIGEHHAELVATILIAKIYHGEAKLTKQVSSIENKAQILANMVLDEYGQKDREVLLIARDISEQVASIVSRGCRNKRLEDDLITKLTEILSSMQYKGIILSEKFRNDKIFIIGILVARFTEDGIFKNSRGIFGISSSFLNSPSSFDFKLKQIVAEVILGYNIDINNVNTQDDSQSSALDDSPATVADGKLYVLSVTAIIHDNPILNYPDLLNTAIMMGGKDKAKIISHLINLCEDHEIAEQILDAIDALGEEKVLEIFFGNKIKPSDSESVQTSELELITKTQEGDQLLEIIAQIETVIGKEALAEFSGWHQYISKALSSNYLSKHSVTMIRAISNTVNDLEEWLDFAAIYEEIDVDNQVTIILSQLENMFDFLASGITHIGLPPRYPDFDPDDYYGDGGGGSGCNGRNHNDPSEYPITIFVGQGTVNMNTTDLGNTL